MEMRELAVTSAIEELERMKAELKEKLYTVKTIDDTIIIAEELEEVIGALQDAKLHKEHFIKYGFIYC